MAHRLTFRSAAILSAMVLSLVFIGCDTGSGTPPRVGTLDVNLTDASSLGAGQYVYAYVYENGELNVGDPDEVLACGYAPVSSGSASFTLMVDDGAWYPTGTEWTGSDGVTYGVYIYTDDIGNDPDSGDYMTDPMPLQVTIDGDTAVDVDFDDMVAYSL